jgi:hypothetical protein
MLSARSAPSVGSARSALAVLATLAMRPRFVLITLFGVAYLTLVGCGDKNLILRVDILSFLDPAVTQGHYGPIPAGVTDSVTIANVEIDLVPGISSVTVVKSADIEVGAEFANLTGSGSGTVRVYFSDPATDPLTTPPIVVPVTLLPDSTTTVELSVAGDPRIAQLFTGEAMRIALRLVLSSGAGPDPLEGDARLTRLRAIVTAGQGVFE